MANGVYLIACTALELSGYRFLCSFIEELEALSIKKYGALAWLFAWAHSVKPSIAGVLQSHTMPFQEHSEEEAGLRVENPLLLTTRPNHPNKISA